MKSEIIELEYVVLLLSSHKAIEYPVLMQNLDSGSIVMFKSLNSGIVLNQGESNHIFGHCSDSWISCDNSAEWQYFKGELKLSNV